MATKQLVENCIWNDKWFRALNQNRKLLFLHLLINPGITPAGLFEINPQFICQLLGIKNFTSCVKGLRPKIVFDEKFDLIWITNYFRKNSNSPKMRKSVENTLAKYRRSVLCKYFLELYQDQQFQVDSIQYAYSIDTVSILSNEHDNDNEHDNENEKFDFETPYQKYPRKLGKSAGMKKCVATIKTLEQYNNLCKAIDNYVRQVKNDETEKRYIKHFSTFMNCWEDYMEYEKTDADIRRDEGDDLIRRIEKKLGNISEEE